jgi:hypothetical protein
MDLSQLKWLKNVRPKQGWAYSQLTEMPIPEAKIFRLHWRSQDDKVNAQYPLEGDLIALVQSARVTHIVEFLDNVVHSNENNENDWGVWRIVKATWMPPESFDLSTLPHIKEIFGIEHLPPNGSAHNLVPSNGMLQFHQHWQDIGGLQGFQQHLSKTLTQIC